MAKEANSRYSSAGEMAADLERWLAGEPILARPPGALQRAWRAGRIMAVPTTLGFLLRDL